MNGLLSHWAVRAGLVLGGTYLAYKYVPSGPLRMGAVAVGAVSASLIVAGAVPVVSSLLAGRLPVAASAAA